MRTTFKPCKIFLKLRTLHCIVSPPGPGAWRRGSAGRWSTRAWPSPSPPSLTSWPSGSGRPPRSPPSAHSACTPASGYSPSSSSRSAKPIICKNGFVKCLQITWFVALLTIDERRVEQKRNACCCCYIHQTRDEDDIIQTKDTLQDSESEAKNCLGLPQEGVTGKGQYFAVILIKKNIGDLRSIKLVNWQTSTIFIKERKCFAA